MDSKHVVERGGEQPEKKQVRVWIDMCADMFHFGHANALRQVLLLAPCTLQW
jgi:trehalose utilization protein